MRRRLAAALGVPLAALLLAGGIILFVPSLADPAIAWAIERVDVPVGGEANPIVFQVSPGENARTIGERLEKAGLIRSAFLFRLLVNYYGVGELLEAGEYLLRPDMTTTDIIRQIRHGLVRPTTITLLEGWRLEQMAQALEARGIFEAEDFLAAARGGDLSGKFAFLSPRPRGATLEGYLFPDTYRITPQLDAEGFVEEMLIGLQRHLGPGLEERLSRAGLSLHEVLTLASIVEREAVLPEERPLIAGVFLRRLQLDMPLAADPTVQYALAQDGDSVARFGYWKKELTRTDLAVDSDYNTYLRTGLPPGPICNPGLASIEAVLEAKETDYLYFVARGDGSHAFAKTLEEHQRNVAKYRGEG